MGLSAPRANFLDIIAFKPVKKLGIKPVGISAPWANCIVIIALQPVKNG